MTGRLEKGSVVYSYHTAAAISFGLKPESKAAVSKGVVVGGGEVYVVIRWNNNTNSERVLRRTAERAFTTTREDALLALDAAVLELMRSAEEAIAQGRRLRVAIADQLEAIGKQERAAAQPRDLSKDVTCSDEAAEKAGPQGAGRGTIVGSENELDAFQDEVGAQDKRGARPGEP